MPRSRKPTPTFSHGEPEPDWPETEIVPAPVEPTALPQGRRIEYLPLDSLKGDPRNPKAHDHDVIGSSVNRFGLIDMIVRDDRTGLIVSGHGRREQLKRMRDANEHPPEGVYAAGGDWLVPVVVGWSSRSDMEAGAALIALNRSTELGGWVDDALLDLLSGLVESGDETALAGVGFTDKELADLAKLVDAGPRTDVGDIADEWDGESGLTPRTETATIVIEDPLVIASWRAWRAGFPSDLAALAELLDLAEPELAQEPIERVD